METQPMQSIRRVRRSVIVSCVVLLILCPLTRSDAQDANPDRPPTFQWNRLIRDWHVIGPFARPTDDTNLLDMHVLPDEPNVDTSASVSFNGMDYQWKRWQAPVVKFRRALDADGDRGTNVVGYAWTEFSSESEQDAILALGHDDQIVAWLNGQQVARSEDWTACKLDQTEVPVKLHAGRNVLLIKIGQGSSDWETLARLRPPGFNKPAVRIISKQIGNFLRLPQMELEFLDADGNGVQREVLDGYRSKTDQRSEFAYFGPIPEPAPAVVRLLFGNELVAETEQRVPWKDAKDRPIDVTLKNRSPLVGKIVDNKTQQPIADARLMIDGQLLEERSDSDGVFRVEQYNPLAYSIWVAAAGFEPRQEWISNALEIDRMVANPVGLNAGAQVLRGTLLSKDGSPIVGATIRSGLSRDWNPNVLTDADGRFELIGIPKDRDRLFPTVTHPEHVPKDRFALDLQPEGETDVSWTLDPGAIVEGKVVSAETGEPLQGVRIVEGDSRFASNVVNPDSTTGGDGRFRLISAPVGNIVLHALSDNHAPAMTELSTQEGSPAEVDFKLLPGKPVTGRVLDPDGKPVHDVWIITDTWNGMRMFRREAHTDKDGNFTLPHMPDTPTETHVLKRDFVSVRDQQFVGGEHYEITIRPVVSHTFRMKMADTGKQPDAVEVQHGYVFDESSRTSWSSNEGRNKYDSATGTYVLQVSEQYPYKRVLRFRVSNYEDVVVDFPDDADGPQMIDVVFKPLEMFGTRVVDADTGVALSNVVVAFVSPNDQMRLDHYVNFGDISRGVTQFTGRKSMTNEDGKFKLPRSGVNDETVLVAIRPDNGFVCVRNVAGLVASKDWELPFPASANIEGVITAGGKPCAGERIRVEWIAPTSQNSRHDFPFGFGGQLQADNQGRFTAKGVGPGRYSIMRVRHFNFPDGTGMSTYISPRQEIVVPPGKTVKCDVSRPAGLSLTAQAVDPNNQPLPNVIITIYGSEDYSDVVEMVLTDSEGRFAAEHLPEATLTMRIRPMGINRAQPAFDGESQFSLKEDTTDAVIRFRPGEMRLRGPGFARLADAALPNNEQQADGQADDDKDKVHVRGQITDRSAVALPLSLTVVCLSETGETFSATSQNDGTFQLKLLPGRYVARINDAPGFYQFSATTFEVKQAGPQDLFTIAVAPAISLFGSVTTSTGEPAIGAVVYVDGMREPARTNEQGQFVLPDVPPRPDLVVRAGDATGTLVGVLPLANVEQIGPLQLSIGKSFTSDGKFGPGCEVPDIRLASIKSLDPDRKNADEQLKPWRFNEVDNTLVVFAELWNPAGRKFALDAAQWAHDHVADLVVISSDWSVRIAARYATELGDNPPPVHWGGPGGAEADRWRFAGGNQCYLVSPRRVFLSCPPQGEMP